MRASTFWQFVAAWVSTQLLIWIAFAIAHDAIVSNMELDLQYRLETDSFVLEDHASRSLDGVVSSLEALAALTTRAEAVDPRKFSAKLRELRFDDVIIRSVSLADPQGRIIASSNLGNVGHPISAAVAKGIGPPAHPPRPGVRFGGSIAQRDLPAPEPRNETGHSIWLAWIDVKSPDLPGHRWVAAINSGFFVNFWTAATKGIGVQVALFDYSGQQLISMGPGPKASEALSRNLREALLTRDNGDLALDGSSEAWHIRYRASSRHPFAFVIAADRARQAGLAFKRTSVLRWSAIGGTVLATIAIAFAFNASSRYRRAVSLSHRLLQVAHTDPLTGLGNRRAFDESLQAALQRAGALGAPLALMILDLDRFKSINDRFGHPAGDAVLREVAGRWKALLRSDDFIARVGGEEFFAVLPDTGFNQAQAVARKLLEATREEPVPLPGTGTALPVTVSMGIVGLEVCPAQVDVESLIRAADAALYRAKERGRDQFVAVEWPPAGADANGPGGSPV
ncbi:GGDEF domain-containing protein [Ramlibacter sp. MAHUQ-53]